MSLKAPDRKTPSGCYNSHSNHRRKKKDVAVSNSSNSNGSSSVPHGKNFSKNNRDDPGALILKLLQNGRDDVTSVAPQHNNCIRPQSRAKHCENVDKHFKTQDGQHMNTGIESSTVVHTVNLFATPPPNRKGRYSIISSCGTNNQKLVNCPNSDGNKSLSSSSSNPTNFALPMYMRSPNPESIPMPCGFPIG
ncbi:hypothetical protein OIY81_1334 [Cryptosporidium canis]|uniref:Uncharacterized protein n=1 Tax=Cryptosporidium canis TaxID=195482 RepID=A0ABQ8P2N1_9CRYT|nr:hypothetical protein OJ252_3338 [Cryptosporidium canis]KAJ1612280.1 hypothetical protein OIY81_1334 [Cryptosporidium canis]